MVQQFLLAGDIGVRGKIAAIEIPDTSYRELAEKNPKKAPVFSQGEGVRKITMTYELPTNLVHSLKKGRSYRRARAEANILIPSVDWNREGPESYLKVQNQTM